MGTQGVRAFTLGIRVPEGLTFESATFGGTALESALLGGEPFYSLVAPTEEGIFATVILSETGSLEVPAGLDQPILNLTFHVEAIPTASIRLLGAQSETPTTLTTAVGTISPTRRALAISGPLDSPAQAAVGEGTPAVSEADLQWSMFEVTREGPEALPEGGGVAALGTGEGAPALSSVCDYETLLGDPTRTPPLNSVDQFVTPGGLSIQDAVNAGHAPTTGDWVISVGSGTYTQSVQIDLSQFVGRTLYIYAPTGPDAVTVQSNSGNIFRVFASNPAAQGNLVLGWSDDANTDSIAPTSHAGWYGFRMANAMATALRVEGITYGSVRILGNWIDDNQAFSPTSGDGAVHIQDSEDVEFVFNEVSENSYFQRGTGVTCDRSWVLLANNWIHDNSFVVSGGPSLRRGGGMLLSEGNYRACRNFIYGNNGIQGGGIYANFFDFSFVDRPPETLLHIEGNEIRENDAYASSTPTIPPIAPYQGGGLCIQSIGFLGVPPVNNERELRLINNLIRDNSIIAPAGTNPGAVPTEVGGGFYVDVFYGADLDGEFHPVIEGNRIVGNAARLRAGGWDSGLHYQELDPLLAAVINNNTIAGNNLIARGGATPQGSGLFVHVRSGINLASNLPAKNSIIWDNSDAGGEQEWFVECGIFPSIPSRWESSVLKDYSPVPTCGGTTSNVDLFGTNSVDADPELVGGLPFDSRLTQDSLAAIDSGDASVSLFNPQDIDGDSRSIGLSIDRGADEYVQDEFIRGDATADGAVNIADMIAILDFLFTAVPLPTCQRAADASDDGFLVIADAIWISNYLFSGGPPPPSPFPNCGLDPTLDPPPTNFNPYEPCAPVCHEERSRRLHAPHCLFLATAVRDRLPAGLAEGDVVTTFHSRGCRFRSRAGAPGCKLRDVRI